MFAPIAWIALEGMPGSKPRSYTVREDQGHVPGPPCVPCPYDDPLAPLVAPGGHARAYPPGGPGFPLAPGAAVCAGPVRALDQAAGRCWVE